MKLNNEAAVGIVVVAGIILTVVAAFWLSGRPWGEEPIEVAAVFREVGELRQGNPVKFRGVEVGRVAGIDLDAEGEGVVVAMQISPRVVPPADAAVLLAPASLFGDWQASIVSRSSYPELEFTTARQGQVLSGATLPDITQLTAVGARIAGNLETLAERVELAFTEETAIKIRETIENVQAMSEQLTGFVDQQTQTYRDVSQSVLVATDNITQTTERFDRVAGSVEAAFVEGGRIEQILANAERASQNLEELSQSIDDAVVGVPSLIAQADTTIGELGELSTSASRLFESLGPEIDQLGPTIVEAREAIAVVQRAAARIDNGEGTLGRLLEDPALFEETQAAIATLRRVLSDLQANPGRYIGEVRIF
ncbi:MAG: MCE family protein [Gemmatimonas sp.]|nr:MCE family protein [Gemmatimonas sp.]